MDESPKKQKPQLLQSAQSRVFLALGLIVFVVVVVAFVIHWRTRVSEEHASAMVAGGPVIDSTPGAGSPSSAYVQAQTQENISGEIKAGKAGTSFVPTITRTGFTGNLQQFDQSSSDNNTSS